MAEFTFLRIDVDGSTFTANAPFSRDPEVADEAESSGEGDLNVGEDIRADQESGGAGTRTTLLAAVVGLVFLLALAFVARRYLAEDGADGADIEAEFPTAE